MVIFIRLGVILFILNALNNFGVAMESEPDLISENLYLNNAQNGFDNPDPVLWGAVREVLVNYSKGPTISEWTLNEDVARGLLWTHWFRTHKGEVRLIIEAVTWGQEFRVEVWQNVGFIFKRPRKTEWARRTERQIQIAVHEHLKGSVGNANDG